MNVQTSNPPSFSSQPAGPVATTSKSPNQALQDDPEKAKQAERAQSLEDRKTLQKLRARDQEVRAHEAAHVAAAGQYVASGPSYTYQRGPDGNSYAIGGEVQLDTSKEAEPESELDKSETIKRAALAPAQPSSQDFSVAASATRSAAQARVDIAVERRNEIESQREQRSGNSAEEAAEGSATVTEAEQTNTSANTSDSNAAPQNGDAPGKQAGSTAVNNAASSYSPNRQTGGDPSAGLSLYA